MKVEYDWGNRSQRVDNVNSENFSGINDHKSDSMNVDEVINVNLATYPSASGEPNKARTAKKGPNEVLAFALEK